MALTVVLARTAVALGDGGSVGGTDVSVGNAVGATVGGMVVEVAVGGTAVNVAAGGTAVNVGAKV